MRSSCCAATLASVVRIFTVMMPPKVYADIFGSSLWTILGSHYRFPSGEKQRCVGKPGQGEKLQAGCRRCQYPPGKTSWFWRDQRPTGRDCHSSMLERPKLKKPAQKLRAPVRGDLSL